MNYLDNPWVIGWIVLALVVAGLALYRKMLTSHEDDIVHVSGEGGVLTKQTSLAGKLEKVDFWGKALTIVLTVYGVFLGAWLIYQGWMSSTRLGG